MLIFSEQNVIKDPPLSKLDMISCRNLLIYMGAELQKKLIPLFHFSLKQSGTLLLDTSEGIGEFDRLFHALDRKNKLYQRIEKHLSRNINERDSLFPTLFDTGTPLLEKNVKPQSTIVPLQMSLKELTEQTLLQKIAPASALVNEHGDILYLHARTGMYLEMNSGEVGMNNVLKMSREGLRGELTSALLSVVKTKKPVRYMGIRVKTNGHFTLVNLTVCPALPSFNAILNLKTSGLSKTNVASSESNLYLVILEDAPSPIIEGTQLDKSSNKKQGRAHDLDSEVRIYLPMEQLRAKDEYLQTTHEELESSNEEMQSVN